MKLTAAQLARIAETYEGRDIFITTSVLHGHGTVIISPDEPNARAWIKADGEILTYEPAHAGGK